MTTPSRTVNLAIAAVICAGLSSVALDRALADPAPIPVQSAQAPANQPPAKSRPAPRTRNAPAAVAAAAKSTPVVEAPPAKLAPRAYVFRGALGPIFSRGMDRLTQRIEQAGFKASIHEFTLCPLIAQQAIEDYRKTPAPIVLIGHSMGGRCSLEFAEKLDAEKIPVSLIVAVDPARAFPDISANVERFINIFLSNNVLGGGDVKAPQDFRGHYASYDLAEHDDITHINIDKQDAIHDQIVAKIRDIALTPATTENGAGRLRYLVPADAKLELWDSSTPVIARAGDTLQTLAEFYHVPLWSLTQINSVSDTTPLTEGQRIVIPRHLLPVVTAAAPPQPPTPAPPRPAKR